jgi:hypothetical protein
MARYTDIDNLIKIIQDQIIDTNPNDLGYKVLTQFIAALNHAPIADVAPRAEVEKIFEEIEKIRLKEIHKCETLREKESDPSERKYWEGGYNSLRQLSYWIAELKKKYTEGEK